MQFDRHFKINEIQIAYEVFDDEVLAVNFDTGTYYSMLGLSGLVWKWLAAGLELHEVKKLLRATCDDIPKSAENDFEDFVSLLEHHGLIMASDGQPAVTTLAATDKFSYKPLRLEIYTDMQDLLLLDPIHDTEEAGWPLASSQE